MSEQQLYRYARQATRAVRTTAKRRLTTQRPTTITTILATTIEAVTDEENVNSESGEEGQEEITEKASSTPSNPLGTALEFLEQTDGKSALA